jgi:O6-methylguanine-DNA--protein-cysteine methyltransferase
MSKQLLANGKNPLLIVVPCHRVIKSGRFPTGYAAGGLWRKKMVLNMKIQKINKSLILIIYL